MSLSHARLRIQIDRDVWIGPVKYAALVQFLQLYSGPVKPKQSSRDEL